MSDERAPIPPKIAMALEQGAEEFAQVATRLSDQLVAIEQWLGNLSGQVQVVVWDEGVPPFLGVALKRFNESWRLVYAVATEKPKTEEWLKEYDWRVLIG